MPADIQCLLDGFRAAAIQAGKIETPKRQNEAAHRLQSLYKELRNSEQGRLGLIGLMADASPDVRLEAAARCLQWAPQEARKVLERLSGEDIFPTTFNAKMTLEVYDAGELSHDY
jgi:hypothetical protein